MTARTTYWSTLLVLAENGRPTPCVASRTGWWTSERPADQARAAAECQTWHHDDAPRPLTCEAMAFDLVRRGLRGKEILDGMFHGLGEGQSP